MRQDRRMATTGGLSSADLAPENKASDIYICLNTFSGHKSR